MNPTLPQRLYLLCFDPGRNKLDTASVLVRGSLLRAAAVAELRMRGLLSDRDGRAVRETSATRPSDPFLAGVLDHVSPHKPCRWFTLLERDWYKAEKTVREQLEANGPVIGNRVRRLGILPGKEFSLADPGQVSALRENTRNTVLRHGDPAVSPVEMAVLAVFSADGDVRSVFTTKERREHKQAIKALRARVEDELPGLRKALGYAIAARRMPASSG
ncbi:GOLPH3/VPS74 family protein [Sciscionella sediminilitoris]|uniref:GOLPH3/VPS74 family protein n=1 Tax=Sciscionella sediminilitoris TaxID=1445613 RepID=UPI0004DF16B1|nr:GPP34 family phosphoprotein [Sciscionella sp. SE31]